MSNRKVTKRLASVKPGTLFVGVDLGLDHNVAAVLDERAEQVARFGFPNDRSGYDYLYRRVEDLEKRRTAPAVLIGMEPTNYFWKLLAADIEKRHATYGYRLVNPYTVKKAREGTHLDQTKDDNRDAFTIGDLLRTGKHTDTRLLHGAHAELREYVTLFSRLQHDIRRRKTLIRNTVGQVFPELTQIFKDLTGASALAMLRHHAAAVGVRGMSQEAFITSVRRDLRGRRLQVAKLRRAHLLARTSVGLTHGTEALQLALHTHIETLEILQRQAADVRMALTDVFLAMPEAKYLLSVRGLGVITAATILSEIGDPDDYTTASQLIKLAGTHPVRNTSGRKTRSRTPMSRKGRPRLRTALFFAVMRLIQGDETFARQYAYLQTRERNPLTKLQAVGALMNKLLRILWSLMKNQAYYSPHFQPAA
jgi:transposase